MHQEGKKRRGKVTQKICERLMHITEVYVFPAWCSSLFTSNISNQLEEETLLSTWNKFCWKEYAAPFAMLGGCTSPSSSHLWGNSNLMPECARRRAAFLLSSSPLNCWVTRFLCTGFTLLPLSPPATSSGMGGRREGEVKGRKKCSYSPRTIIMIPQGHI